MCLVDGPGVFFGAAAFLVAGFFGLGLCNYKSKSDESSSPVVSLSTRLQGTNDFVSIISAGISAVTVGSTDASGLKLIPKLLEALASVPAVLDADLLGDSIEIDLSRFSSRLKDYVYFSSNESK